MWYLNTLTFRTFDREYLINQSFDKYFSSVFPYETLVDKQDVLTNIRSKLITLFNITDDNDFPETNSKYYKLLLFYSFFEI